MTKINPEVDWFFNKPGKWQETYGLLRRIILSCGLAEELKWGKPCYTLRGKNVLLIHGFKDYCAVLFHKGALLNDPKDVLIQQTKNTQSARQIRFSGAGEVAEMEDVLKAYIFDAIKVEKSGREVTFKKTAKFDIPEEFQEKLDENPALKAAFESLTPGRRRGYLLHFSGAKQSKTRRRRVKKSISKILDGKGLNDV